MAVIHSSHYFLSSISRYFPFRPYLTNLNNFFFKNKGTWKSITSLPRNFTVLEFSFHLSKKLLFNVLPSSLTKVNLLGCTVTVTPHCLACRFLMEVKELKIVTPRKINKQQLQIAKNGIQVAYSSWCVYDFDFPLCYLHWLIIWYSIFSEFG